MSRRPLLAPLLLGAAALVAATSWWLSDNPLTAGAQAAAQPPPHETTTDPAVSPLPLTPAPGEEPLGPMEDRDDGITDDDLWAHISDADNSDVPPDLFAELTELGADVVRADATGMGRDRWPDYWADAASGRADPCCTDIAIHAAGAYTDPTNKDVVHVTVVWTAAPNHAGSSEHVADILLVHDREGWRPTRR